MHQAAKSWGIAFIFVGARIIRWYTGSCCLCVPSFNQWESDGSKTQKNNYLLFILPVYFLPINVASYENQKQSARVFLDNNMVALGKALSCHVSHYLSWIQAGSHLSSIVSGSSLLCSLLLARSEAPLALLMIFKGRSWSSTGTVDDEPRHGRKQHPSKDFQGISCMLFSSVSRYREQCQERCQAKGQQRNGGANDRFSTVNSKINQTYHRPASANKLTKGAYKSQAAAKLNQDFPIISCNVIGKTFRFHDHRTVRWQQCSRFTTRIAQALSKTIPFWKMSPIFIKKERLKKRVYITNNGLLDEMANMPALSVKENRRVGSADSKHGEQDDEEEDAKGKGHSNEEAGLECPICYETYPFENMVACSEADHLFCKHCLNSHQNELVFGHQKINTICFFGPDECKGYFPETQLERGLEPKTRAALNELQVRENIQKAGMDDEWWVNIIVSCILCWCIVFPS